MLSCQCSLVDKFCHEIQRSEVRTSRREEYLIFFLFSSFFFYTFIAIFSVSWVCPLTTAILSRFPTINYRILTHKGSKDRFNLWTNFIVLDACEIAELHKPRSHCAVLGILLIEYPMSLSLHGWSLRSPFWATSSPPPSPPPSERPASYTAGHVDHEKRNTWVS